MATRFKGELEWALGESVGEGGQGFAYWATRIDDGTTGWILKRLRDTVPTDRFEREVEALRRLDSPRIPRVVDYGLKPGQRFYVTPYRGTSLVKWLEGHNADSRARLDLLSDIAEAVVSAHSVNVAHRDIKPNNIVVDEHGRASLIDWGLSAIKDDELVSLTPQDKYGNEAFSAPECLYGSPLECGVEADIYSLGKLLYWMSSGGMYIHRERVRDILPETIAEAHFLDRVYISSLIHASVREGTYERPQAAAFRDHIQEVIEAIDVRRARERDGIVTLWDTLGPRESHSRSGSRSVTAPPHGNPPQYSELGLRFLVPPGTDLRLAEVSLALSVWAGPGHVLLRLHENGDDQPADVIGNWPMRAHSGVSRVTPTDRPILHEGNHYWITFQTDEGAVAWWAADSRTLLGLRAVFTERYGREGRWPVHTTDAGHAARILALH